MSGAPRVLVVEEPARAFATLVEAATAAGTRLGWLDLVERPATQLDAISELGFLRAVAVDDRGSIAVKPRRGAPVLRDLLREHFVGCAAVLVRLGEGTATSLRETLASATRLRSSAGGWSVSIGGHERNLDGDELLRALGRPSFWRSDDEGASP